MSPGILLSRVFRTSGGTSTPNITKFAQLDVLTGCVGAQRLTTEGYGVNGTGFTRVGTMLLSKTATNDRTCAVSLRQCLNAKKLKV